MLRKDGGAVHALSMHPLIFLAVFDGAPFLAAKDVRRAAPGLGFVFHGDLLYLPRSLRDLDPDFQCSDVLSAVFRVGENLVPAEASIGAVSVVFALTEEGTLDVAGCSVR